MEIKLPNGTGFEWNGNNTYRIKNKIVMWELGNWIIYCLPQACGHLKYGGDVKFV